ncbi:hypothetical protein, partial [Streptomyces phaeochromogenes]|uniref:hypothetical protein n=1 Tax=Streptomyces phaeochromogenes TaxID=1923 RepID=UPI003711FF7A
TSNTSLNGTGALSVADGDVVTRSVAALKELSEPNPHGKSSAVHLTVRPTGKTRCSTAALPRLNTDSVGQFSKTCCPDVDALE